jgi:arylsulfatase A-like enzyme
LKALLALYDEEPNVVIVSDHGHGRSTIDAGWLGWHANPGIFLAAGPSVPKTTTRIKVSYYDIVPTLASLKGFDRPSGLRGAALFREHQPLDAKSKWW